MTWFPFEIHSYLKMKYSMCDCTLLVLLGFFPFLLVILSLHCYKFEWHFGCGSGDQQHAPCTQCIYLTSCCCRCRCRCFCVTALCTNRCSLDDSWFVHWWRGVMNMHQQHISTIIPRLVSSVSRKKIFDFNFNFWVLFQFVLLLFGMVVPFVFHILFKFHLEITWAWKYGDAHS